MLIKVLTDKKCYICGEEKGIEKIKRLVQFDCNQNDGRAQYNKPEEYNVILCETCIKDSRLIKATGAQGYNKYWFLKEEKRNNMKKANYGEIYEYQGKTVECPHCREVYRDDTRYWNRDWNIDSGEVVLCENCEEEFLIGEHNEGCDMYE